LPSYAGELNLGSMFATVGFEFFFLVSLFVYFPVFLFLMINKEQTNLKFAFATSLLLLSFIRPCNRYLIFVAPFFYLVTIDKLKNIFFYFSLILFFIMDIAITCNFIVTSRASNEIYLFTKKKNIIEFVDYNEVLTHIVGQIPMIYSNNKGMLTNLKKKKYLVMNGEINPSLFIARSNFLFFSKKYSIVEIRKNE
jgi:hypothetical protein